jgi:hypothetical protein
MRRPRRVCAQHICQLASHLDRQVYAMAQISIRINPLFSAVESRSCTRSTLSIIEEHNEAGRTEWHKLLNSFRNVKTLRIAAGLVKELSHCLQDDGEPPVELLPELQELSYSGSGNIGDPFTSFVDARQNAGRPITLIRLKPSIFGDIH